MVGHRKRQPLQRLIWVPMVQKRISTNEESLKVEDVQYRSCRLKDPAGVPASPRKRELLEKRKKQGISWDRRGKDTPVKKRTGQHVARKRFSKPRKEIQKGGDLRGPGGREKYASSEKRKKKNKKNTKNPKEARVQNFIREKIKVCSRSAKARNGQLRMEARVLKRKRGKFGGEVWKKNENATDRSALACVCGFRELGGG